MVPVYYIFSTLLSYSDGCLYKFYDFLQLPDKRLSVPSPRGSWGRVVNLLHLDRIDVIPMGDEKWA